jgi:hypothetical protein
MFIARNDQKNQIHIPYIQMVSIRAILRPLSSLTLINEMRFFHLNISGIQKSDEYSNRLYETNELFFSFNWLSMYFAKFNEVHIE